MNEKEISKRKSYFGCNDIDNHHKTSKKYLIRFSKLKGFSKSFLNSLNLFSIKIFILVILLSILISATTKSNPSDSWIEGFAIFLAMFICVLVASITDYELNLAFIKLSKVFEQTKEV